MTTFAEFKGFDRLRADDRISLRLKRPQGEGDGDFLHKFSTLPGSENPVDRRSSEPAPHVKFLEDRGDSINPELSPQREIKEQLLRGVRGLRENQNEGLAEILQFTPEPALRNPEEIGKPIGNPAPKKGSPEEQAGISRSGAAKIYETHTRAVRAAEESNLISKPQTSPAFSERPRRDAGESSAIYSPDGISKAAKGDPNFIGAADGGPSVDSVA